LTRKELESITNAPTPAEKIDAAVELCRAAVAELSDGDQVDVVVLARPPGIPDGADGKSDVGFNFHGRLKVRLACMSRPIPIQLIRPVTWKGGAGVEDPATTVWNLFSALL
jgi:hypothetical protein